MLRTQLLIRKNDMKNSNEKIITIKGEQVDYARLLTLKTALRLEVQGLKGRGRSAYSIVKEELGFRGSKQSVLDQLSLYIALPLSSLEKDTMYIE